MSDSTANQRGRSTVPALVSPQPKISRYKGKKTLAAPPFLVKIVKRRRSAVAHRREKRAAALRPQCPSIHPFIHLEMDGPGESGERPERHEVHGALVITDPRTVQEPGEECAILPLGPGGDPGAKSTSNPPPQKITAAASSLAAEGHRRPGLRLCASRRAGRVISLRLPQASAPCQGPGEKSAKTA